MKKIKRNGLLVVAALICVWLSSCYRNDIEFGATPENNYSRLVYVDTISPVLSTILSDSFVTGNAQTFLLGKYKDPYLGIISAKPFFQLAIPTDPPVIPGTAQYDSAVLMIRPNNYYYGDTSRAQTIQVNELAQTIEYSYNNSLYNTSNAHPGTRCRRWFPDCESEEMPPLPLRSAGCRTWW